MYQNFNPYQQYQFPYQPQQSYKPMSMFPTLSGKYVENIEMVKSTDIPMTGETVYFPQADGSLIYSKKWTPNGTTEIVTYEPIHEEDNKDIQPEVTLDVVIERLDALTQKLDEVSASISSNNETVVSKIESPQRGVKRATKGN